MIIIENKANLLRVHYRPVIILPARRTASGKTDRNPSGHRALSLVDPK